MTASEKLARLEQTMRKLAEGGYRTTPSGCDAYDQALAALPALREVVESAEEAADHFVDQSAHDHGWPVELKAALARLSDALGRRTVTTPAEALERVRRYIEGHQKIVDGPDETFTRELAPSAREPLAALSDLQAHIERLERERDAAIEALDTGWSRDNMKTRAEAAEAKLARYEDALRGIERAAGAAGAGEVPAMPLAKIARGALADSDTPPPLPHPWPPYDC